MTRLSFAVKLLLASGLFILGGLALETPRAIAGAPADRAAPTIESQVGHKLAMLPWYGVFDHLQYQVNGTEVILSGQLISEHDRTKDEADNDVKSIPGVTNVVNNIQILPLSTLDNRIRRDEYRTIFSNSNLGRYSTGAIPQLHIIVNAGHVTLEGSVMNKMDHDIAGIVANSVPGVFSVTNNLQIG